MSAPTEQAMRAAEAARPDLADMAWHHPQESERVEGMRRLVVLASAIDTATGLPALLVKLDALRAALRWRLAVSDRWPNELCRDAARVTGGRGRCTSNGAVCAKENGHGMNIKAVAESVGAESVGAESVPEAGTASDRVNAMKRLVACLVSLRELVQLLDEPAEVRPMALAAAVERAKAALAGMEQEAPKPEATKREGRR